MFTGIIESSAAIIGVSEASSFRRLTLASPWPDLRVGQSVAVNGACLTVAELDHLIAAFDVITETLSRTNLGMLGAGDSVHLERPLRAEDRFDGHFVQGHVDGLARLVKQTVAPGETRLTLQCPDSLMEYIAPKGSVALDGVSLTVAAVESFHFEVALIPTTLRATHLGAKPLGWPFNLECDMISKTVIAHLRRQSGAKAPEDAAL